MTRAGIASLAVTLAVMAILLYIGTDAIAPFLAHFSTTMHVTA
jgi:hypothetical protein